MAVPLDHRIRILAHLARAARISPLAAPGSLLKQVRAAGLRQRAGFGRHPRIQEPSHLAAVRACPCLKCGMDPCGEAAHVRLNSAALGKRTGISEKPDDRWAVPLCGSCHRIDPDSQHQVGEVAFWNALGINPLRAALALHRASPDIVAMRAAAHLFIAGRG